MREAAAREAFRRETEELAGRGLRRMQGRRRVSVAALKARFAKLIAACGLREEEMVALVLYTGPMYLVYNARLRGFPAQVKAALKGNRYETTILLDY